MNQIIIICNVDTNEYFFTTDHCQPHNLGEQWVSTTNTLPMQVTPRESLPSGIITNKEEYKLIFCRRVPYSDIVEYYKEISNPDPKYQA